MGDWIDRAPPANNIPNMHAWENMSSEERLNMVFVIAFFIVAFLTRKTKYFGWMWKGIMVLFLGMVLVSVANLMKNRLKEWWKE
jgi:hypothetical protein